MSHAPSTAPAAVPGPIVLPASVRALAAAAALAGIGTLAWIFSAGDLQRAWGAYLIAVFFTIGLGVSGAAWLAIFSLTNAAWSVTLRRIPEAMTAWLLPGGVLAMGVGLGAQSLYEWSHADVVAADRLLMHKASFLNLNWFYALVGLSLLVWLVFSRVLAGTSYRQDADGGVALTRSRRTASAIFLVLFALTLSVVTYYLIMSLEPHWFSTMLTVLVFTDLMQAGTAFVVIFAAGFVLRGTLKGLLNEHHLHSLGKMLFAWTGFWAYIYFCQFMLIRYANIPEETSYFLRRAENGWLPYLLLLPALKFVVPFLLLLPRQAKRTPSRLVPVAFLILFAQFWELYLMVRPALGEAGRTAQAGLPFVELAVTIGALGLFTLVFGWMLGRHGAIPRKDPALAECLDYQS